MANIYYLPGYGGRLDTGLGGALLQRGFNVSGRQTIGDFRALPFDEQVAVVRSPLVVLHHIDFDTVTDAERRKLFVGLTRGQLRVDLVLSERAARALLG